MTPQRQQPASCLHCRPTSSRVRQASTCTAQVGWQPGRPSSSSSPSLYTTGSLLLTSLPPDARSVWLTGPQHEQQPRVPKAIATTSAHQNQSPVNVHVGFLLSVQPTLAAGAVSMSSLSGVLQSPFFPWPIFFFG